VAAAAAAAAAMVVRAGLRGRECTRSRGAWRGLRPGRSKVFGTL